MVGCDVFIGVGSPGGFVLATSVAWIFAQVFRKTLTRVESISPESFKCSEITSLQNWPRGTSSGYTHLKFARQRAKFGLYL